MMSCQFLLCLIVATIGLPTLIHKMMENFTQEVYSVRKGGTVLITDAAHGEARELAIYLASQGLHVLAGVRTDSEARSFIFEARKGVETVLFDINEPALIAKAIYRIKQVKLELDRPLTAVVFNIAGRCNDFY